MFVQPLFIYVMSLLLPAKSLPLPVKPSKPRVTITGISGYLGSQTCLAFLKNGSFQVRGTVRSKRNPIKIDPLKEAFGDYFDSLEIVEADITDEKSMILAMEGSDYIVHTASPFPLKPPKDEKEVIGPAVEGTISVMKAARIHKVKKVIITSSTAAVYMTGDNDQVTFSEDDWTNTEIADQAYMKSKTLSERAAWDYVRALSSEEKFDLVTINPGVIIGPNLNKAQFTSGDIIRQILLGRIPGLPKVMLTVVDVRDVANAHLQAVLREKANNKRFIVNSESIWANQLGQWLFEIYGNDFKNCVTRGLYKPIFKVASWFSPSAATAYKMWGRERYMDNSASIDVLGIEYISAKQSLREMVPALIDTGYI